MDQREIVTLTELVRGHLQPDGFHPVALYHRDLDTIHVWLRDCSTTEFRLNDVLDVLVANHLEREGLPLYVGFNIHGAQAISRRHGLIRSGRVQLDSLLSIVAQTFPDDADFINLICARQITILMDPAISF